jgi:uncharacterized protein
MAKTALELTPEELRQYDPTQNLAKSLNPERWEKAWELVPQLAAILREQFGATRVVVFGSLTRKESYTHWSGINLAAWDISPGKFYSAMGTLMDASPDFKIDLVDPADDSCPEPIKRVIEQKGIDV